MKRGTDNKYLLAVLLALLAGCATPQPKQAKIIRSEGEITVKSIQLNDGDVIICDKNDCRVVSR